MADNVRQEGIAATLEQNYMPYAMSVIVSRAIPEIDGLKPAHRKLLYTMYKMGLLTGPRTKSANVVGQTMKLNPHGDASIYETMVRLARGAEVLLVPYVDSKGNFGKVYSRDMAYAASRYTEVKLAPVCEAIFRNIDHDTVDFVDNYDGTMKEPLLLPVTFPTILVNPNQGIAVGMANSICSFNLKEVCETTIERIKNPDFDVSLTLKGPDFPTGAQLIYNAAQLDEIYRTGRGSIRLRAVYTYDKKNNCIDITEIPYSTTAEAIIDKVVDLVKSGKVREITDIRDETGNQGLRITIDLKRGVDPLKLMERLYRLTPLENAVSCNFNILIGGIPRVMGFGEILDEWTAFRIECITRELHYDKDKKADRLHELKGLAAILLDIDKAIKIIRETEFEQEVVPNLMIGFGIDEIQAGYVCEIRLRNLNREYILKRTQDIETLEKDIAAIDKMLADKKLIKKRIIKELGDIAKKYGEDRKTSILYPADIPEIHLEEEEIEDYPVELFLTKEGYFKKITPLALRMSKENKLKEGDEIVREVSATNRAEVLFFTNRAQVYRAHVSDFEETKAKNLGEYLPAVLALEDSEEILAMVLPGDYQGQMLFFFENGKCARVPLASYQVKGNRRKLTGAYSDKTPLVALYDIGEDTLFTLISTNGKYLIVHSDMISLKATRSTVGVAVMSLRGNNRLHQVRPFKQGELIEAHKYMAKSIPAAGSFLSRKDREKDQLGLGE